MVKEADLGVNFFLDESSLGKPRSQCCTELLQELNPDVQGEWFPKEQVGNPRITITESKYELTCA